MKVTHSLTGSVIDLPKYFTNGSASFMIVDEKSYLKIYDGGPNGVRNAMTAYTKMEPTFLLGHEDLTGLKHLSETEFKNAYLQISLVIEETLNN